MDKPIEKQWMFHSIAKAILGLNILRNDERVDKVGICGISWGSVITSLTLGYDSRFDFAVPIYGGGYMLENKGFCGDKFREAKVSGDNYLAEKRFHLVKTPTFFLCDAADTEFPLMQTVFLMRLFWRQTANHHLASCMCSNMVRAQLQR